MTDDPYALVRPKSPSSALNGETGLLFQRRMAKFREEIKTKEEKPKAGDALLCCISMVYHEKITDERFYLQKPTADSDDDDDDEEVAVDSRFMRVSSPTTKRFLHNSKSQNDVAQRRSPSPGPRDAILPRERTFDLNMPLRPLSPYIPREGVWFQVAIY
jgi:hypothetical protein